MRSVLAWALGCAVSVGCTATPVGSSVLRASPPNILLIVADDLGWTDVAALDPLGRSFYATPNLDRLVARSQRYTHAYSSGPNCAPSRAALATGLRYPRQPIYTVVTGARGQAEARGMVPAPTARSLPTSFETLAERLQSAGYATWFVGKWHLGDPGTAGPVEHGFDVNVAGHRAGFPASYFSPYGNPALADGPEGEYLTTRLTDEACALIEGHEGAPFFLQLAYYSVHTPLQAPLGEVARFEARTPDRGHGNATYAAMLAQLDRGVGRVLTALDAKGLTDETLVIFTSDNGGLGGYRAEGLASRDVTAQTPLRGGKGMLFEGGIRVPLAFCWPGRIAAGATSDEPVTHVDLLPTLCGLAGAPFEASELDGRDLAPTWRGESGVQRDLVWHFPGYLESTATTFRTRPVIALRRGRYKLLHFFEDERTELYDLREDPSEAVDLAVERPETTRELLAAVRAWLALHRAPLPERG